MEQRRVLVAVSAGIAAYKIPELVRALRAAGHEVVAFDLHTAEPVPTPSPCTQPSRARL